MEDRKITIGFVADDIRSDFTTEITAGLMKALPKGRNIKLVVIAGMHEDAGSVPDNMSYYKKVYNSIYRIHETCRLDGLIISMGSKAVDNVINSDYSDIPKIYIASDIPGEASVNYNNETGIREAVNYLVNVKGYVNICMLGGRDDNKDSVERKRIFMQCLADNGITFSDKNYEKTNMSEKCVMPAEKLIDNNPDVQAVFCVNDAVARGLYKVMDKRGLIPGKDMYVFGFDNTHMAVDMIPSLSSIGADSDAIGQKAIRLLMDTMNGKKAKTVRLPTRLYGRQSFPYETYEYTTMEMINVDKAFIYRVFDDCFYRYRNERNDGRSVDLRRLFYEIISRMLYSMKNRYMDVEEFEEIGRMIDIFFQNGAIEYTDAPKLLDSIEKLQGSMNIILRSAAANVNNNRLFQRMKDASVTALSEKRIIEKKRAVSLRDNMRDFLIDTMDYKNNGRNIIDAVISNFDRLGLRNAALYLYDTKIEYDYEGTEGFHQTVLLQCVMRQGELYIIPEDRRECPVANIFSRSELYDGCEGYIAFPVFYYRYIYGILVCELSQDIMSSGGYIADQLGRTFYISERNSYE